MENVFSTNNPQILQLPFSCGFSFSFGFGAPKNMFYYLKVKWRKWPQQQSEGWQKVKDVLPDKQRTEKKGQAAITADVMGRGRAGLIKKAYARPIVGGFCGTSRGSYSPRIAPRKKIKSEIERLEKDGQFHLMMV